MNGECHLQISKHLVVHADLNSLSEKFESVYSLDGAHILPPLMTDLKRLEMQQLRMRAMAIEMSLKRSKPGIAEQQIRCLMPRMVNASTNTALTENLNSNTNPNSNPVPIPTPEPLSAPVPAPLVVMGRFRQELQKSETAIYDHRTQELITVAPGKSLPILTASRVVIENKPQRAVFLPEAQGTMRSSLVPKINSNEPLLRSTTTIDLRERMPGRPVVFPCSSDISMPSPKSSESRFRSRIPIRHHRGTVLPPLQQPEVTMIEPGHVLYHDRSDVKANSANERRRNYGAKVAMKRNEMVRKREELAKLKPPPRTTNYQTPKSIRTPIRRVVEGGESSQEQQRHQIQESPRIDKNYNNNQVPKSIRTPVKRAGGDQVPKSIRTPIKRVEGGAEESHMEQKENIFQLIDQHLASTKTNNNQVAKSITTEGKELEVSDILKQMQLFQSLTSRQEAEQQRLQDQLEQQQQGLIDQLIGHIAEIDSQDTAGKVVVDQEQ
ncbi:hypothetical protein KR032_009963 [Drosophila birchii]|nr:hypothetical protein KR032_009963 [Drosophila birchii]